MIDLTQRLRDHERHAVHDHDDDCHAAAAETESLRSRLADMETKYRDLTVLMDQHYGTPCEQIRHQQEIDELQAERALLVTRAENAEAALAETDERRHFWQQQSEDRERWLKEREAELAAADALLTEVRDKGFDYWRDKDRANRIDAHLARKP
jgi:chromosome segregation ATPase